MQKNYVYLHMRSYVYIYSKKTLPTVFCLQRANAQTPLLTIYKSLCLFLQQGKCCYHILQEYANLTANLI